MDGRRHEIRWSREHGRKRWLINHCISVALQSESEVLCHTFIADRLEVFPVLARFFCAAITLVATRMNVREEVR